MSRLLLTFVTALAVVLLGAPLASGREPLKYGLVVNSQGWGDKVGQQQDNAVDLGVSQIRESFEWSRVNPHGACQVV